MINERLGLENFLDPKKRMDARLESEISALGKKRVVLVILNSLEYADIGQNLLPFFEKQGQAGIFVSVNKPAVNIIAGSPAKAFAQKSVEFVDCVSRISGTRESESPKIHYLESPQQLVELSELLTQMVASGEARFLVLDSLSTLLIYNKPESIEKFVHTLSTRVRAQNVLGIFLIVKTEQNRDAVRVLSQFCDAVIEIGEKKFESK